MQPSFWTCFFAMIATTVGAQVTPNKALVTEEFVYQNVPFPQCHASTLVETTDGTLVCAWFGGICEGHPEVGIWVSRQEYGKWTQPVEVANGIQNEKLRYPTWNPVLFQKKNGPLMLFFKVGPNPKEWWGEWMISNDAGKTWKNRQKLPEGFLGPVKNKAIELADGTILAPTSSEKGGVWTLSMEYSSDSGKTWQKTDALNDPKECQGIQPTILTLKDGTLKMLARNRKGNILSSLSQDCGKTWSRVVPMTLPNPNSGIDGVTLYDGRHLLVYNPTGTNPLQWGGPRNLLVLAISDDAENWKEVARLEQTPGMEYSYPAILQSRDGRVHITYTWRRQLIKHLVFDYKKL